MQKQIFIVGVGRSGTTLLQSMLNAHPEIGFTPETHFVKKYIVPALTGVKKFNSETLQSKLEQDKDIKRLSIDFEKILKENPVDSIASLIEFFKKLFNEYIATDGKIHLGDKDPMNAPYMQHIHKAFPEAYLIHIIRDPRDVILSRIKSQWGKNTPFFQHVAEYQQHIQQALHDGPSYFGKKYIEVLYENLINDPKKELKRICNELDVVYSENMMNYHQQSKKIVFDDEKSWKENVFRPVIKENTQKWRKELSPTQIAKIEGGIEDVMQRLGYSLSGHKNWFARNILSLPIKLTSLAYKLKQNKEKLNG